MSWMNADADDIQAALEVVAKRPDADAARVIAFGYSAGGAASIALGARNLPGLLAVVSIAGGAGMEGLRGCAPDAFLTADFKDFGARNHIPNLWVYAKNDPRIPPADAELMRAAFSAAGGDVKFVMLDPLGDDGHAMMVSTAGYLKWLPEMDTFLQVHGLPTWQPSEVDVLLHRLGPKGASQRSYIEKYMSAPGEKALAWSETSGASTFSMKPTIEAAKNAALQECEARATRCVIIMENDRSVCALRGPEAGLKLLFKGHRILLTKRAEVCCHQLIQSGPQAASPEHLQLILNGLLLAAGCHAAFLLVNARLEAGVEGLHAPYFADLVGTFGRTFVRARALTVGLAFFGAGLLAKHRTGPNAKGESRR